MTRKSRCGKGLPCGNTCISSSFHCIVDFPQLVANSTDRLRHKILGRDAKPITNAPAEPGIPTFLPRTVGRSLGGEADANLVLKKIKGGARDVSGSISATQVNWKAGVGKGAVQLGRGSFGVFVQVPKKNLARGITRNFPQGVGIKYGKISEKEAEILKKAGDAGVGPKLIAARVSSTPLGRKLVGATVSYGAVAMALVPGQRLDLVKGLTVAQVEDYVRALRKLHLVGIAHNDAAGRNSLIHKNKVRFVDFGLAQNNWKAAMAEAFGGLSGSNKEFFAARQQFISRQLSDNLNYRVLPILRESGFSEKEIRTIVRGGIRKPDNFYESGPYAKVSNRLAKRLIREFYEGFE